MRGGRVWKHCRDLNFLLLLKRDSTINDFTYFNSDIGGSGAPLNDRQLSLSLVLELALQQGKLLHLLKALLLLLQLSNNGNVYFGSPTATAAAVATDDDKDDDNVTYDNEGTISRAPLVPILRRVADIPTRDIKRYSSRKKKDENSVSLESSAMYICLLIYIHIMLSFILHFLCRMWVWLPLQPAPPSVTWTTSRYPMTIPHC